MFWASYSINHCLIFYTSRVRAVVIAVDFDVCNPSSYHALATFFISVSLWILRKYMNLLDVHAIISIWEQNIYNLLFFLNLNFYNNKTSFHQTKQSSAKISIWLISKNMASYLQLSQKIVWVFLPTFDCFNTLSKLNLLHFCLVFIYIWTRNRNCDNIMFGFSKRDLHVKTSNERYMDKRAKLRMYKYALFSMTMVDEERWHLPFCEKSVKQAPTQK